MGSTADSISQEPKQGTADECRAKRRRQFEMNSNMYEADAP